jgi:RNA polymerase sigma-70 factor (ECF subfamily)
MSHKKNLADGYIVPSFNAVMFDDVAFEIFFKKHFKALCIYCQYKFYFDADTAKEIAQTAFVKLWENRQTLSPELSIQAYIYTIVTNISLDIMKLDKVKRRYIKYISEHVSTISVFDDYHSVDFKQLENIVEKAVAELPEQMRRIFELSRNKQLKYAEIALQLGISVKTVETQMSRALVKLRKKISSYTAQTMLLLFISGALLQINIF